MQITISNYLSIIFGLNKEKEKTSSCDINILWGVFFQDGRIDYGEFVAMMQKGNPGIGRRTMRNSLNMSMRDARGAH